METHGDARSNRRVASQSGTWRNRRWRKSHLPTTVGDRFCPAAARRPKPRLLGGSLPSSESSFAQDGRRSSGPSHPPKIDSKDGLRRWTPKMDSEDGLRRRTPKMDSEDGLRRWTPKTDSEDGPRRWTPKMDSEDGLRRQTPKVDSEDGLRAARFQAAGRRSPRTTR